MDLFVVPTIGFELLYGFVIVRIDRRDLIWINVTTNPTAEWIARRITEAFPWDAAPGNMRLRSDLWRRRHTPIASHGHSQRWTAELDIGEAAKRTTFRSP
jgi:hypothetical protein